MNGWLTIELKQLRFFGYHGLYPEEKKTGNEFEVNLDVSYPPPEKVTAPEETIDYVKLYQLLQEEMKNPRELLETLVTEIAQSIHQAFPRIKKIDIGITKLQAPITGFRGRVGVRYVKEF